MKTNLVPIYVLVACDASSFDLLKNKIVKANQLAYPGLVFSTGSVVLSLTYISDGKRVEF